MNISPLNFAIKQTINNLPATKLDEGGQATLNFQVPKDYKLLKDIWRFKGTLVLKLNTAPTTAQTYTLEYKADHFYRLLTSLVISMNSNINIKEQNDLSFNRMFQVFENIGFLPYVNIPTSISVKANQSEVKVPFEFLCPFWYVMPDMIGSTQTFIYMNLFTSMTATFKVGYVQDIIFEVQDKTGAVVFGQNKPAATADNLNFSLENFIVESASDWWLVAYDYLKSSSAEEVLAKMGKFFKTIPLSQSFTGPGRSQFIKLTPTITHTLKDIWIVARDIKTGKRADGIIDRIKIADGDRPLVDANPIYLREDNMERYNLDWSFYDEFDATQPDNQGKLYGIDRIDTTFFGEVINAQKATANWRNPMLTFDLTQEGMAKYPQGVMIDVYQSYIWQPTEMQAQVNNFISQVNSPM